jgi:UDP-N-acetylglucosamine 2-epimerase (non-hydrolysing)
MPEEINRVVTDAIADVLWTPSADADENLQREGVPAEKIDLIGNIMIDSFEMLRSRIESSTARTDLGLAEGQYALVTLHRPSNVDAIEDLGPIVDELIRVADDVPAVFVAHPRTIKSLKTHKLFDRLSGAEGVTLLDPLPYVDFMNVVTGGRLVITDSGGLQEETTYLGIPCLTMRENTERPVTIDQGTSRLVNATNLHEYVQMILSGDWPSGVCPPLWDGETAGRAVAALRSRI